MIIFFASFNPIQFIQQEIDIIPKSAQQFNP